MKAKSLAALAVIALVIVLAWSYFSGSTIATREDAVKFVLDDLRADSAISNGAVTSVFSTNHSDSGQWTIVVKVTQQPHSACPSVFIRSYDLLPIRRSLDRVVVSGCVYSKPLAYAEEAIIASKKDEDVAKAISAGASSCGFALPLSEKAVNEYCPTADFAALVQASTEFSSARWLVSWGTSSATLIAGINSNGDVVGKKTA